MKARRLIFLSLAMIVVAGCAGDGVDHFFTRVWGSGASGSANGDALAARFNNPVNVEAAPDGTVFVADFDNNLVRQISTSGIVSTVVNQADFARPFGMAITPDGTLYVQTDQNDTGQRDVTTGTVWRVNVLEGTATVVARNIGRPRGLQALADGRIAMADTAHHTIRILDPSDGSIVFLAGQEDLPGFANGTGMDAQFNRPYGMALDQDGSLLVADQENNRIRRMTLAGVVSTFAGSGTTGAQNGSRATARFNRPIDVTARGATILVADHDNFLIRRISGDEVSTFAGNGMPGFVDGLGTAASFFGMEGISLNSTGSVVWIADGNNGTGEPFNRVRRLQL